MRARPAADIFPLRLCAVGGVAVSLPVEAHRLRAPARMLAIPRALSLRRLIGATEAVSEPEPRSSFSSC
jgi:hypothetical protein